MADKDQQAYPETQANGHTKRGEESTTMSADELRRKKRMKYLLYFVLFVIFQVIVITVFVLTVMKVRTPKFRVRSATIGNIENLNSSRNPSFNIQMNARVSVKNTNFGPYKFQNGTIYFFYRGTPVGEAVFPKRTAGFRSTKKFDVNVSLSSSNIADVSRLRSDLGSGVLTLTTSSQLKGKVALIFIMKKKKNTKMDCTLTIGVNDRTIRDIRCQ